MSRIGDKWNLSSLRGYGPHKCGSPAPGGDEGHWSALLWGVSEFCVASLADGGETARHLWIFHVFTDVTIFMAMVFAASQSEPDRG